MDAVHQVSPLHEHIREAASATSNDSERTSLIEILETHLAKLSREIHQTNSRAYRDMLEEKQTTRQQMLSILQ